MSIQMAINVNGWVVVKSATWTQGMWRSIFEGKLSCLLKGMVPFVALIHVFGKELANRKLLLMCSDTQIAHILTCHKHKDHLVMHIVRKWVLSLLTYNISFSFVVNQDTTNYLALNILSLQVPQCCLEPYPLDSQPRKILPTNWPIGFL